MDSPSVFYDATQPQETYRLLTYEAPDPNATWSKNWGLYGYVSEDGLHWQPLQARENPLLWAGDRTTLMSTKAEGKYVLFTRDPKNYWHQDRSLWRSIYRSESEDFLHWSPPELVLEPDLEDDSDIEFYGMSVFERHGWFLGLLEYWHSATDAIEIHLAFSRDGKSWCRPAPRQPFIAPTYDWNRTWSSCASNGPIVINEQMVFYFGGRWTSHHWDSAQQAGVIGYASLALDRFCALEGREGGVLVTRPMRWPGGELCLNADTRQSWTSHPLACHGEIHVEVLRADGRPLEEWSGHKRGQFSGNTHARGKANLGRVRWPSGNSMSELQGEIIRFRFALKNARLFTFMAQS
jgi:hypothetical protein